MGEPDHEPWIAIAAVVVVFVLLGLGIAAAISVWAGWFPTS